MKPQTPDFKSIVRAVWYKLHGRVDDRNGFPRIKVANLLNHLPISQCLQRVQRGAVGLEESLINTNLTMVCIPMPLNIHSVGCLTLLRDFIEASEGVNEGFLET